MKLTQTLLLIFASSVIMFSTIANADIQYKYDKLDRISKLSYNSNSLTTTTTTYYYDPSGNITEQTTTTTSADTITDTDNDQLGDEWETYYFTTLTTADITTDSDSDRYSDYWEYQNWRAHVRDPNGKAFHPLEANTAGGRGYDLDAGEYPPDVVTDPVPAHLAESVNLQPQFSWAASSGAASYQLFLGMSPSLGSTDLLYDDTMTSFAPSTPLLDGMQYYWRVDACQNGGINCSTGQVWQFTTEGGEGSRPEQVSVATPAYGATGQPLETTLRWQAVEGATAYAIRFGTTQDPPWIKYKKAVEGTNSHTLSLAANTTYYWQIDSANGYGATAGKLWQFTTGSNSASTDPLIVEDLWMTGGTIYAHPDESSATKVFESKCTVTNNSDRTQNIQKIALAVHYPYVDGDTIIDLYDPNSWTPRYLNDVTLTPGSSIHFPISAGNLKVPGQYHLRVNIYQNNEWRAIATKTFEVFEQPAEPPAANTPFPASGATNIQTDVTMSWSNTGSLYAPGGDIPPYVLCMDTNSNITQSDCTVEVDSPQYKPTNLQQGEKYYWRIASFSPTGQSLSPLWSFTTIPLATEPSGQLSVMFNNTDDSFTASYTVNEHTEQVKIFYSYDNGSNWNQIFTRDIMTLRSLSPDLVLPDVENHQSVLFYLQAIRNSGTPGIYETSPLMVNYSTEAPVEKPGEPAITVSSKDGTATLEWRKLLDSHYKDTITNYEIEYATNNIFSSNRVSKLFANPATGSSLYENLSYLITGLADYQRYYFRVRAQNSAGTGEWSNIAFTDIVINDTPVIDSGYQEPADNATGISKTPILRWRASDEEGDSLYYGVWFGKTPGTMDSLVSIDDLTRLDENTLTLPHRWQKTLEPGTTYYWQVRTREQGHYADSYRGTYPASPIWSFTTETSGPDPAITDVVRIGDVLPDSSVLFQVTVKNLGVDSIESMGINSSYIKNSVETPFHIGTGSTGRVLAPGEETTVDITVKFNDSVIEQNGLTYDNVLIGGTSTVKFTLRTVSLPDVNTSNNSGQVDITYTNPGGPVISYFDLREYKSMLSDPANFKARTGKKLQIVANATDDTRIVMGRVHVRRHSTDSWTMIYGGINNDATFSFVESGCLPGVSLDTGNAISWTVPADFLTTEAEVRVRFWDESGVLKGEVSSPFDVVSGDLTASITAADSLFQVGQNIEWNVNWSADSPVVSKQVYLRTGARIERIMNENDANGLSISNPDSYTLPDDNSLASQYCTLELQLLDAAGNEQRVVSESFQIQDNNSLPTPFNEAVTLYTDEFNFPSGAIKQFQEREVDFLKLDSANVAHVILRHEYRYFDDTASGVAADIDAFERNMYYLTYDPVSQTVSSKILVCDKQYSVVSFEIYNAIPYILLKNKQETLFYSYLDSGQFQSPVPIENTTVPEVTLPLIQVDSFGNQNYGWVQSGGYAYLNGEQWLLDIPSNIVQKRTFTAGNFGPGQEVPVTNNAGNVESRVVKPAIVGDKIYFIDVNGAFLVQFDTAAQVVERYPLPVTIDTTDEARHKVALLSDNGKLFFFADGHIFEFVVASSLFTDHGEITFTFGGVPFSIATLWNEVSWLKTVTTENSPFLVVGYNSYPTSPPLHTKHEILEFDSQTVAFTKTVVRSGSNQDDRLAQFRTVQGSSFPFTRYPEIEYIGNNKVLVVTAAGGIVDSSGVYDYESGLQLLDLETGDITFINYLGLESSSSRTSLLYENGHVNLLTSQESTGLNVSSVLDLSAMDTEINEIESPELVVFNDLLYATWSNGIPFDGRWDSINSTYVSKNLELNKKYDIMAYPSVVENIANSSLGFNIAVNGDYLASYDGQLYTLFPDFSLGELITEMADYRGVELLANNGQYAGALCKYIGGSVTEIQLVSPDASSSLLSVPSNGTVVAAFPEQIISAGYGYGDFSGKNVVTKQDSSSDQLSTIVFGSAGSTFNFENRADINENQYVAVGWDTYLALADFSADIVAPSVNLLNTSGPLSSPSEITLNWEVNDNLDQIDRFELFTINNGIESSLATINDPATLSHTFTLTGNPGDKVCVKLVAYDTAGNSSYDKVDYEIVQPVVINNFSVNKTHIDYSETLEFSWSIGEFDPTTIFTVFRREVGDLDWRELFSVTGQLSFEQEMNSFVGEYEFKLEARNAVIELANTVNIIGELLQFDPVGFSPATHFYVQEDSSEHCRVPLNWAVTGINSPELMYSSVYVQTATDPDFVKVGDTLSSEYTFEFSGPCTDFFWKVQAEYRGATYVSQTQNVSLATLVSPSLTNLTVTHGATPTVTISFDSNIDSGQYHLMRRTSTGQTTEVQLVDIAAALQAGGQCVGGVCSVDDSTAAYGKIYQYYVVTSLENEYYEPGEALSIDLTSAGLSSTEMVTISNPNYAILSTNSFTLQLQTNGENNIASYEILLGYTPSSLSLYRNTSSTSVLIEGLVFNRSYCVQVYGLDRLGARTTPAPAQLFVSTPPSPVPETPFDLTGIKDAGSVELLWKSGSEFDQIFIVERKTNIDVAFVTLATTANKTFLDSTVAVAGGDINYRVKAYTATGTSNYSNIYTVNLSQITDSDNDGMDDDWERFCFDSLTTANGSSDFDGDGYYDRTEFLNWRNGVLDPAGYGFDPKVFNISGGQGYHSSDFNILLFLPAILNTGNAP